MMALNPASSFVSMASRTGPITLENAITFIQLAKSSTDSVGVPGLAALLAVTLHILETAKVQPQLEFDSLD